MQSPVSTRCFLASTFAAVSLFGRRWRDPGGYPNQNVRFLVAFPAGGPTDAIARILARGLPRSGVRVSSSKIAAAPEAISLHARSQRRSRMATRFLSPPAPTRSIRA